MTDTPAQIPFRRTGLLALDPQAFGIEFAFFASTATPFELVAGGSAAVINVTGPLTYDGFCTQGYGSIRARFEAALASDARTVVIAFRSPGGEVAGAFDCARALPKLAKAAGKRYVAFCETQCASAAYALAAGADEIVITDTASVGSIGVISVSCETTAADKAAGLHFEIFASGERKADGNPHQKWTDEARASAQASIDESAAIFFDWVAECRKVRARPLEGAIFMGERAVSRGLADRVATWDELLAELGEGAPGDATQQAGATQQGATQAAAAQSATSQMPNDEKDDKDKDAKAKAGDYRKALKAAADDGDKDAARALKALDDKPKDDEGDDKDKDKDGPPKSKKAESAAAAPAASADPLVAGLLAQVQQLSAVVKGFAEKEAANERAAFMATRPDLNADLVKALEGKPLAEVKAIVAAIPVTGTGNPFVPQLHGSLPRGGGPAGFTPNAELDRRMGITQGTKLGVIETDQTQVFGVRVLAEEPVK